MVLVKFDSPHWPPGVAPPSSCRIWPGTHVFLGRKAVGKLGRTRKCPVDLVRDWRYSWETTSDSIGHGGLQPFQPLPFLTAQEDHSDKPSRLELPDCSATSTKWDGWCSCHLPPHRCGLKIGETKRMRWSYLKLAYAHWTVRTYLVTGQPHWKCSMQNRNGQYHSSPKSTKTCSVTVAQTSLT